MNNSLSSHEQDALAGLAPEERDKAFAIDRMFRELAKPILCSLKSLATELEYSETGIRKIYYRWKKRGVLACVDQRKCPVLWKEKSSRKIPKDALEYWLTLQLDFQRDTSLLACHREFMRRWRANEIPGLPADCRTHPRTGLPYGCHYRNLSRRVLTTYQAKAVRIGRHHASRYLPKVISTRVGSLPGQIVEFDDQDHDVRVAFVGVNSEITRPSGFHTLDFTSGCDTMQGFKPTVLNPDGTKQKLRQIDFEWFVVGYLTQIGYRADTGSEFIWERGTSKSSSAFMERMLRATNDKVSVRDGGLHREPALAGLFHGPAKGNPRVKGARECWFRLFREECAALSAPTGKDRDHAPEGSAALDREARLILAAMRAMPNRAQLFQLPCLTWPQFLDAVLTIVRLINSRTAHALEGWEESGFVAHEWRFALESPWLDQNKYLALPDPQKQLFQGLLNQTPELWRTRRLSPTEVWESRKNELTKVSGSAIPLLFGPEHARKERVEKDLSIQVADQEISPTPLIYDAVLTNGRHLTRGQQVAVYLNPFAPDTLQVCDEDLRWLGTAERVQRIAKTDFKAAIRRYDRVRKIAAEELAPVARRGIEITRRETARALNNSRVADRTRPFTQEERDSDRERKDLTVSLDEFVEIDSEPVGGAVSFPRLKDETLAASPTEELGGEPHIASLEDFL